MFRNRCDKETGSGMRREGSLKCGTARSAVRHVSRGKRISITCFLVVLQVYSKSFNICFRNFLIRLEVIFVHFYMSA